MEDDHENIGKLEKRAGKKGWRSKEGIIWTWTLGLEDGVSSLWLEFSPAIQKRKWNKERNHEAVYLPVSVTCVFVPEHNTNSCDVPPVGLCIAVIALDFSMSLVPPVYPGCPSLVPALPAFPLVSGPSWVVHLSHCSSEGKGLFLGLPCGPAETQQLWWDGRDLPLSHLPGSTLQLLMADKLSWDKQFCISSLSSPSIISYCQK